MPSANRLGHPAQDEALREINGLQARRKVAGQDHGEIQGSGANQHRPAPARSPRDTNSIGLAPIHHHVIVDASRGAEDDRQVVKFPGPEQGEGAALLDLDEQGLVHREVRLDRRQGKIKQWQVRFPEDGA